MNAMKTIRLLVLLLGVAFFWSGVRKGSVVSRLKAEHEVLVSRARSIGVPENENYEERSSSRAPSRPSSSRIPAERLKDELVAAYHRLKSLEDSEDPETRLKVEAEVREWIGRLIDLSPKELKRMIADLTSDSSLDPKEVRDLISVALNLAASRQGEAAAELALLHRKEGGSVSGVMSSWARLDPSNAFAWLARNKAELGEEYQSVLQQAVSQSGASDPAQAIDGLQLMPDGRQHSATAKALTAMLADEPSRAAMAAAILEKEVGLNDEADLFDGLGKSMVDHAGDLSAAWLKGLSSEQAMYLANGVNQSSKALERPGAWLDWMAGALLPEQMSSTAKPLLTKWINEDYEAAGEWINRQPAGDFRNEAAANYARMMAKRFPDTAKDWANSLPEGPEKRCLLEDLK